MNSEDDTRLLTPTELSAAREHEEAFGEGTRLGSYVLLRGIARGGCGSVYEAEHVALGKRVAIKVLRKDFAESTEMVERFILEARAVNMIRHPNIVDIFEFGIADNGQPFHVMELLEGVGLDRLVRERGRLPEAELLEILEPICAALAAAHAYGVVHRDLKPSNIVVGTSGTTVRATVVDFGIAKLLDVPAGQAGLTAVGRKLGTPVSMAPEQIMGVGVTQLADVYALGVLIFFCLAGRFPFVFRTAQELEHAHLLLPPPPPSGVAHVLPGIDALTQRCMAKDPAARFPSVGAVLEAFRSLVVPRSDRTSAIRSAVAVGLYVDVESTFDEEDPAEELATIDDAASVVEAVEQALLALGWEIAIRTGSAILGVRLGDTAYSNATRPSSAEDAKDADVLWAEALALRLAERANAHPANLVTLAIRTDTVLSRSDATGKRNLSGSLLRVHNWSSGASVPEIRASSGSQLPQLP
jgi:eukaryotic-like serine/threonine-protein kinase